jgi:hypothetical protein
MHLFAQTSVLSADKAIDGAILMDYMTMHRQRDKSVSSPVTMVIQS